MSEKGVVEFWNLDSLKTFAEETKDVEIFGKLVRIKKLPASIMNAKEDANMVEQLLEAVVEPKISKKQFDSFPIDFGNKLIKAISEFSSIGVDDAEKN